jgi:hypothetical protein
VLWPRKSANQPLLQITLEPLRLLPYPPFRLSLPGKQEVRALDCVLEALRAIRLSTLLGFQVTQLFDGTALAQYMVSQCRFENPMNREPLSRDDCRRLDAYVLEHTGETVAVAEAYDLQQKVKVMP